MQLLQQHLNPPKPAVKRKKKNHLDNISNLLSNREANFSTEETSQSIFLKYVQDSLHGRKMCQRKNSLYFVNVDSRGLENVLERL